MNFIDLSAQYQRYKSEIDAAVHAVLDSSQYIMGQEVALLERELASYCGVNNAIACSSGTDALVLALMALDIQPGDEVITTPFSFIATAEAIALLRATPVFADIDAESYTIAVSEVQAKITPKTKAIIAVSLFGQTANMKAMSELAGSHGIILIEDAAQSFGARYQGVRSCNLSTLACTSFFPAKVLGCYGDGGAVFTGDDALAEKMRALLNHGQTEKYVHTYIGINGRLDSLQAAVLRVKLHHLDDEIAVRQRLAAVYDQAFTGIGSIQTPQVADGCSSVYAQYSLVAQNRDAVLALLEQQHIPTAIHYPIPLHMQEAFRYLGYSAGDFPVSERIAQGIFSLPMSAFLTEFDQNNVIASVRTACIQGMT